MSLVVVTQPEDIPAWLILAAEVEPLFGPLVNDPSFHRALHKNIGRGTAFCVRDADEPPDVPLHGGLLFSPKPPIYTVGWLAVAIPHRRHGIGQRLIEYVVGLVDIPAELIAITFRGDNPAGEPARRLYEQMGFHAAESVPNGPEGSSRQVFRRAII